MVDSHQVLIDNNCNGKSTSKTDNASNSSENLIRMNDTVSQQGNEVNGGGSDLNKSFDVDCEQNGENLHKKFDDPDQIMCGSSPIQECSNINENPIRTNKIQPYLVSPNGTASPRTIETNIETINASPIEKCSTVKNQRQTSKSNDSYKHGKKTTTSTTVNPGDRHQVHEYSSVELPPANANISVENQTNTNKMDSRKVEPIRININRDPIKTKIKLAPSSHECQTISPKSSSSSSNNDDCDNIDDTVHENTQTYPKITIKPIIKPQTNHHHNHCNAGLQASSSSSSTSHETIPKLKIKKVDSNSTANNQTTKTTLAATLNSDEITSNYQTHILSESSTSVPT